MIELRIKNGLMFAVSSDRIFPGCQLTEDNRRVLGRVVWDKSMDNATFWRVYGDGVCETIEKVDGQWAFLENSELLPADINMIAIDMDDDKLYNGEVIVCGNSLGNY